MELSDIIFFLIVIGIPLLRKGLKSQDQKNYKKIPQTIKYEEYENEDKGGNITQHKAKSPITQTKRSAIKDKMLREFEHKHSKKSYTKTGQEASAALETNKLKGKKAKNLRHFLNKEDIRKGIILKEVLGPPKCRKKHF